MSNGEGNEGAASLGKALVWLYQKQKEGNKACKFIWLLLKLALLAGVVWVIGIAAGWW